MLKRKAVSFAAALAVCMTMAAAPPAGSPSGSVTAYAVTYDTDTAAKYAEQVAELVNRQRAANGLAELKLSEELCSAANVRAKEIQSVFSHTRPNGTSCFTALKEKGISYTYAGENIAYGQRTPEAVMKSWMDSPGHRANILSSRAEYIGIGVTYKNGTYYWTQFFAAGKGMRGAKISSAPSAEVKPQDTPAPQIDKADIVTNSGTKDTKTMPAYLTRVLSLLRKYGLIAR